MKSSFKSGAFFNTHNVVGLPNTDRTRDLTPTHIISSPAMDSMEARNSGGGEKFISFIEKVVTHIGIINMGELLFQGTMHELRNLQINQSELHIETSDNIAAFELLRSKHNAHKIGAALKIIYQSKEQVAQIVRELIGNNIDIYEVTIDNKDLEQLFLQMTENYTVC